MLKEYALQPELLSSWPVFRYLSDKFGYGRGRVIAEYPKKWRKMVYESLGDCKPMEKKRIEIGLIKLRSALYPRPWPYEWDKNKGWLDNAIEEHTKRPFSAIIAQDNPHGVVDVIREADLDEEAEPWKAERQRRIERTATEMAACAKMLLRNEAYPIVKTKKSEHEDRLLYGRTAIDYCGCPVLKRLMLPQRIVAHTERP